MCVKAELMPVPACLPAWLSLSAYSCRALSIRIGDLSKDCGGSSDVPAQLLNSLAGEADKAGPPGGVFSYEVLGAGFQQLTATTGHVLCGNSSAPPTNTPLAFTNQPTNHQQRRVRSH